MPLGSGKADYTLDEIQYVIESYIEYRSTLGGEINPRAMQYIVELEQTVFKDISWRLYPLCKTYELWFYKQWYKQTKHLTTQ